MAYSCISLPFLQWILRNTAANKSVHWYKSLEGYYRRPEWELYDLKLDPEELHNAAEKTSYKVTIHDFRPHRYYWNCPHPGSIVQDAIGADGVAVENA